MHPRVRQHIVGASPAGQGTTAGSRGPSPRLRVVIATLIALTSMLGAVAAWRASVASSAASDADRKGFADTVAREQERAVITSQLDRTLFQFLRARSYGAQSEALRREVRRASELSATTMRAQGDAYERLAEVIDGTVPTDALTGDSLTLSREFRIEWESVKSARDLDPTPEYAAADANRARAEHFVGLTALLIAAAFFFTLAQISKSRAHLVYFSGGSCVLVVATALLVVEAS